ncbi:MAG: DUF72 domain-containing protein [Brevinematia bacterium]
MNINIGTSGYNYNHWKGIFYPEDMKSNKFFSHYQKFFSTVEINYTFYHFPRESTIKKWYEITPDDFLYSIKVPRLITHLKKLCNIFEELKGFVDVTSNLNKKLGILLFQMPPSFKYSIENIERILAAAEITKNINIAIEFRHKSWFENDLLILTEANISVVTVSAPSLPFKIYEKSKDLYIRLHGKTHWYGYNYTEEDLREIANSVQNKDPGKTAWIYFNNDFGGFAVLNALRLKEILVR